MPTIVTPDILNGCLIAVWPDSGNPITITIEDSKTALMVFSSLARLRRVLATRGGPYGVAEIADAAGVIEVMESEGVTVIYDPVIAPDGRLGGRWVRTAVLGNDGSASSAGRAWEPASRAPGEAWEGS